jgi:hypothetical protein
MTIFLLANITHLPYFLAQSQQNSAGSAFEGLLGFLFGTAAYVFASYCMMKIYDKLGEENSWFAWVPILNNVILYKAGGQSPLWTIGLFIPFINIVAIVFLIIAFVKIVQRLGKNPWLLLLMLIPLVNFWLMYHFAFN